MEKLGAIILCDGCEKLIAAECELETFYKITFGIHPEVIRTEYEKGRNVPFCISQRDFCLECFNGRRGLFYQVAMVIRCQGYLEISYFPAK